MHDVMIETPPNQIQTQTIVTLDQRAFPCCACQIQCCWPSISSVLKGLKKKKRLATQVAKASLEHRTKEYYHHKLHEVILTCETQHGSHMSPCVRGEQSAPFFLHEMGLVTSFCMPPSQSELTRCASFLPKRPPRHEKAPIGQLLVGLSCRVALLSASATGCVSPPPPPPPPTAGCCSRSLHPPPAYLHTRRWRWWRWWWWWWWRWWWWWWNAVVLSRLCFKIVDLDGCCSVKCPHVMSAASLNQVVSWVGVWAARVLCWFVVLLANSFEWILFWAWYWHLCSTKIIMLQKLEPGSGIFYFLFWKLTKLSHFHESDYKSQILIYYAKS